MEKRHQSTYTDKLITDAQFLAEFMCERQARNEGEELPKKFYYTEKWLRPFRMQMTFANQILKVYSFEAIMAALRTKQGSKIYSLGAKWFDPIIKQEEQRLQQKRNFVPDREEINIPEEKTLVFPKTRPVFVERPIGDKFGKKEG